MTRRIALNLCLVLWVVCIIKLFRIKMYRIDINDYFYCALNKKIYMKRDIASKKKWNSRSCEENRSLIFKGFDKLAENEFYKTITHKSMIYWLMACEEQGYIKIIYIKKCIFPKNIGKLKKQLGAKKVNKKWNNVYFVKIRTTKDIKNYNISEMRKKYYKICRNKPEI